MLAAARILCFPSLPSHWRGAKGASHVAVARPETAAPARARPVAAKAALRVYRAGKHWFVREEGGEIKGAFVDRLRAIEFARLIGMGAGSYRIVFETIDGGVLEERFIPR